MYCINCGVKLAESELKCPLCGTAVYHPDLPQAPHDPLYPSDRMPQNKSGAKALGGAIIILFCIPLLVTFFGDLQTNGSLNWFGYVAGALIVVYTLFALPLWFRKPNPVIFVPCDFAAVTLYLMYINLVTDGDWFLTLALPITVAVCLLVCTPITLIRYVKKGILYIIGGTFMGLGGFIVLIEHLLQLTFDLPFIGWSMYPLVVMFLLGGLLIYLAIDRNAREAIAQKLFF